MDARALGGVPGFRERKFTACWECLAKTRTSLWLQITDHMRVLFRRIVPAAGAKRTESVRARANSRPSPLRRGQRVVSVLFKARRLLNHAETFATARAHETRPCNRSVNAPVQCTISQLSMVLLPATCPALRGKAKSRNACLKRV